MSNISFKGRPSETNKKKKYASTLSMHIAAFLYDLEHDWIVSGQQSFIYKFFQNKNSNNDKAVRKKVQDFFYNNCNGRCNSVTIEMLVKYCDEHSSTPNDILRYGVDQINLQEIGDDLPHKNGIFPLLIDVLTGTVLWIRTGDKLEYIVATYDVDALMCIADTEWLDTQFKISDNYEEAYADYKSQISESYNLYKENNKINGEQVPSRLKKYVNDKYVLESGSSIDDTVQSAKKRASVTTSHSKHDEI